MSDKRSGKKAKQAAAPAITGGDGAAPVVSDLTKRPEMKKKKSKSK